MPRPGPRPYECVRRAWHSDRHQPIRGSLIQQIFRVVNEAHAPATKKNKEWQEKLPVVVLKAEEIMYSKANSEAEYTNLDTLWDRVNDAINTIIRRQETTETGDLLPPCVEAALNLGCIPVRASRSQRHSNPRTYLTPRPQEPPTPVTRVVDRTSDDRRSQMLPFHSGNQSSFTRTPVGSSPNFHPDSNTLVNNRNNNLAVPQSCAAFSPENALSGYSPVLPVNTNTSRNRGSVYPLYYGAQFQGEEYQSGLQAPETAHSKTIYVGTPVIPSTAVVEPSRLEYFAWPDAIDARENPTRETECDLSLRLGMFSQSVGRSEHSFIRETEDFCLSTSTELGKLNEMRQSANNEFCFFPGKRASDPSESSSRMWSLGGEGPSLEAAISKGKEPLSGNDEDGQFCWQSSVPSNWFNS